MCHEIEGIDILLTGHQHREIAQTVGNDVTILQTGCNGHSVGKVTVTFEKMKQEWVKRELFRTIDCARNRGRFRCSLLGSRL